MFQFCIRNLEFAYGKVNRTKVNGKQTIYLFMCKCDVKFLHTDIHHKSRSNEVISEFDVAIDCYLPEETNAECSPLSKGFLKSKTNQLFKIRNIQSSPILGSYIPNDCRIQYTGNNVNIPSTWTVLRNTIVTAGGEIRKVLIEGRRGHKHLLNFTAAMQQESKLLHSYIQSALLDTEKVAVPHRDESSCSSIKAMLDEITCVELVDTCVIHPYLRYKATVYCIACYGDEQYLIHWQLSLAKRPTLWQHEVAAIHVAACIGAVNACKKYPLQINKGLLVIAYPNGDPAHVHVLKNDRLEDLWKQWLIKTKNYYNKLNEMLNIRYK